MSQILVVDDEPAIRDFVRAFLEDEGYRVSVGRNGAEALRQVRDHRPDLVLMDIMMPGLDGREVVRQLHEHPVHSVVPIILMSAAVQWDHAVDGSIQFLHKPFDLDHLLAMISTTLRQRSATSSPPAGHSPSSSPSVSRGDQQMDWSVGSPVPIDFR